MNYWIAGAFKSKTMWFNMAVAVLGVLELQSGLVKEIVGVEHFGAVMLLISSIGAALRAVTTTPLDDK